jgi:hypothetical protein
MFAEPNHGGPTAGVTGGWGEKGLETGLPRSGVSKIREKPEQRGDFQPSGARGG